jgi:hypothetical protein
MDPLSYPSPGINSPTNPSRIFKLVCPERRFANWFGSFMDACSYPLLSFKILPTSSLWINQVREILTPLILPSRSHRRIVEPGSPKSPATWSGLSMTALPVSFSCSDRKSAINLALLSGASLSSSAHRRRKVKLSFRPPGALLPFGRLLDTKASPSWSDSPPCSVPGLWLYNHIPDHGDP